MSQHRQASLDAILTTLSIPSTLQIRCWHEDDTETINQLVLSQGWPLYPDPVGVWQRSWPALVAVMDGHVVGYVRGLTDETTITHISDLLVDERYRRHGIARYLMEICERLHPQAIIHLIAEEQAIAFYEAIGFELQPRCYIKRPKKAQQS